MGASPPALVVDLVARKTGTVPDRGRVHTAGDCPEFAADRAVEPDLLTLDLDIDDKPLKEIIGSLYYPDCPYEFSVCPPTS